MFFFFFFFFFLNNNNNNFFFFFFLKGSWGSRKSGTLRQQLVTLQGHAVSDDKVGVNSTFREIKMELEWDGI